MKDIWSLIDISSKGKIFKAFSDEELLGLLKDYYLGNKKLVDLINIYDLETTPSLIRKHFPKIMIGEKCEKCGNEKYKELPTKAGFKDFVENIDSDLNFNNPRCTICGHIQDDVDCLCMDCRIKKRELILKSFSFEEPKRLIKFKLKERLILAVILQGLKISNGNSECRYEPQIFPQLFFEDDYLEEIRYLYKNNILVVSPSSPIDAFVKPSKSRSYPNEFYIDKVSYSLKNLELVFGSDENWFENLKFPHDLSYSLEEKQELWMYIVTNELLNLFDYQFLDHNFHYKWDREGFEKQIDAIKTEIRTLLIKNMYTPGQVYAILWIGIRNSIANREKIKAKGYPLYHKNDDVQFVISYGIHNFLKYNKEIKKFEYPKSGVLSVVTRVFFEQILKQQNWFDTKYPDNLEDINLDKFLSELSDEKKQELKKRINSEENEE